MQATFVVREAVCFVALPLSEPASSMADGHALCHAGCFEQDFGKGMCCSGSVAV